MATAQQAVSKARSQVGTTEVGSSNKVKFNDWYWGKGKYGSWAAWCSVFMCWCSDQLGMRKNVAEWQLERDRANKLDADNDVLRSYIHKLELILTRNNIPF